MKQQLLVSLCTLALASYAQASASSKGNALSTMVVAKVDESTQKESATLAQNKADKADTADTAESKQLPQIPELALTSAPETKSTSKEVALEQNIQKESLNALDKAGQQVANPQDLTLASTTASHKDGVEKPSAVDTKTAKLTLTATANTQQTPELAQNQHTDNQKSAQHKANNDDIQQKNAQAQRDLSSVQKFFTALEATRKEEAHQPPKDAKVVKRIDINGNQDMEKLFADLRTAIELQEGDEESLVLQRLEDPLANVDMGDSAQSLLDGDIAEGKSVTYTVRGRTYQTLASSKGFAQEGKASWYGPGFHGRKTASGERFNMHDLTAAHKELPLGSRVLVTNKRTGKSVVVRINDRGPFHSNRVIDLSRGAAKELGILGSGVGDVSIRALK